MFITLLVDMGRVYTLVLVFDGPDRPGVIRKYVDQVLDSVQAIWPELVVERVETAEARWSDDYTACLAIKSDDANDSTAKRSKTSESFSTTIL